jgi:hypothetical protein
MQEWLAAHLPEVHARLGGGTVGRPAADKLLGQLLGAAVIDPGTFSTLLSSAISRKTPAASLRAALAQIAAFTPGLDLAEMSFPPQGVALGPWPDFAFLLALATPSGVLEGPFTAWSSLVMPPDYVPPPAPQDIQDTANNLLDRLAYHLDRAIDEAFAANKLGAARPQAPDAARLAAELAATLKADTGPPRYVLRFVHQRCDCGPLHPAVMSEPSEVFELAGFFDPEAPLRPIRIALPFDTSPGGLRKFGKNSAFIMSDLLCGQMKRVRRLGFGDLVLSVLPWPFHKDLSVSDSGPCGGSGASSFGTICSLSIPIITIVAFVLLIVIATLLDLIFRWLPFLMVCFPIPGLKGKK